MTPIIVPLDTLKAAQIDTIDGKVRMAVLVGSVPIHHQTMTWNTVLALQYALDIALKELKP